MTQTDKHSKRVMSLESATVSEMMSSIGAIRTTHDSCLLFQKETKTVIMCC